MLEIKSIEEITTEIVRLIHGARQMWGVEFDANNTINDWCSYATSFFGAAVSIRSTQDEAVEQLSKAAVVTLSALYHAENKALAPRHYEDRVGQPRKQVSDR